MIFSSSSSEFLAEESQEKFWDFVEANQNIDGEHDGRGTLLLPALHQFSLLVSLLCAAEFMMCMQASWQRLQRQWFVQTLRQAIT